MTLILSPNDLTNSTLEILHELVFSKLERTSSSYPEKKARKTKKKRKKMLYGMIVFCQLIVVSQYFIPVVKSLKGNHKIVYPSISNVQKRGCFRLD